MGLMRRKKFVRLHLETTSEVATIEGILERKAGGHYRVLSAAVVTGKDQSMTLEGDAVLVPCERIVFIQELRQ